MLWAVLCTLIEKVFNETETAHGWPKDGRVRTSDIVRRNKDVWELVYFAVWLSFQS